jgi:hypothetical protein
MTTTNVNNVTNQVTRITTINNITNISNLTSSAPPNTPLPPLVGIYEKDCQKILDVISKCACCKIHAINRPAIYKPFVEVPNRIDAPDRLSNTIIDIRGVPKLLCECDCRINARMICRSHPDYKP